jgi:peptidoglycan/LPS O-acetylase OafA/YrhL
MMLHNGHGACASLLLFTLAIAASCSTLIARPIRRRGRSQESAANAASLQRFGWRLAETRLVVGSEAAK